MHIKTIFVKPFFLGKGVVTVWSCDAQLVPLELVAVSSNFLFSPLLGEDSQFD